MFVFIVLCMISAVYSSDEICKGLHIGSEGLVFPADVCVNRNDSVNGETSGKIECIPDTNTFVELYYPALNCQGTETEAGAYADWMTDHLNQTADSIVVHCGTSTVSCAYAKTKSWLVDQSEMVMTSAWNPCSSAPTKQPTSAPTDSTGAPSAATSAPSKGPSSAPTPAPTGVPSAETGVPTKSPSSAPTPAPTTVPTTTPTTAEPTLAPTGAPSAVTTAPTPAPTTAEPTLAPTGAPSAVTSVPTKSPSSAPTPAPTTVPTTTPTTAEPTLAPTGAPSAVTTGPTSAPSTAPTPAPTTAEPTLAPTSAPSAETGVPTKSPSSAPTPAPTGVPSAVTSAPTKGPSLAPTDAPTKGPTTTPAPTCGDWEQAVDCAASTFTASSYWTETAVVLTECHLNSDGDYVKFACDGGMLTREEHVDLGCTDAAPVEEDFEPFEGVCADSCMTLAPTAVPTTGPTSAPVAANVETPSPTQDGAAVKDLVFSAGCALMTLIMVNM